MEPHFPPPPTTSNKRLVNTYCVPSTVLIFSTTMIFATIVRILAIFILPIFQINGGPTRLCMEGAQPDSLASKLDRLKFNEVTTSGSLLSILGFSSWPALYLLPPSPAS